MKKLEECLSLQVRQPQENIFLIDWLTVVFKSKTVADVQLFLGLQDSVWTTEKKFRNGYPMTTEFSSISIWWGADNEAYYDSFVKNDGSYSLAADKVRMDMGVCLNMSGQGCRSFEEYSHKSWIDLLSDLQYLISSGECNVTRFDLAYDDHVGLLPLWKIHNDVKDRNFRGPAKKTKIIWSDDMDEDLQGLTIEIGSNKSEVLIRIYDKAAERGYDKHKHWVRTELQLRRDRATTSITKLFLSLDSPDVGTLASGILRNYCMFVTPSSDSNKSRWPVADYWERILQNMERIRLWKSPGEPYNFTKAENTMIDQYYQFLYTYKLIHGNFHSLDVACHHAMKGKNLKKKYLNALSTAFKHEQLRDDELEHLAASISIDKSITDPFCFDQTCFADLFENNPFDS